MTRFVSVLGACALAGVVAGSSARAQVCVGDCNGNGVVAINELVIGVNIDLGLQPVSACPAFANSQNMVDIAQLVKGVNNALNGCNAPSPTPTVTPAAGTERVFTIEPGTLLLPPGNPPDGTRTGLFTGGLSGANAAMSFSPGPLTLVLGAPDSNGVAQLRLKADVDISVDVVDSTCLCLRLLAAGGSGSIDCDGGTPYDTKATRANMAPTLAWTTTTGLGDPAGPGDGNLLVMGVFERLMVDCATANCPTHVYTTAPNVFGFTTTNAISDQETSDPNNPLILTVGGEPFSCANFATPNSGGMLAAGAPTTIDPIGDVSNVFRLAEVGHQHQ